VTPVQVGDKVVLVTGASSGIGRATALRLAAGGARVVAHGRDQDRLNEVARAVDGTPLAIDLAAQGGASSLAKAALAVHGRVDVLVSCAGTGWSGRLLEMDEETARQVLTVGLLAPIALTRALLPAMLSAGSGAFCFVGSIAGRTGVAGEAVYAATKGGLDGFAASLRLELAGSGLGVSTVIPGAVRTRFFDRRGRPYARSRPQLVEPDVVAAAVVGALASATPEVYVPRWLRAAAVAKRVSPAWFDRVAARFGEPVRATGDRAIESGAIDGGAIERGRSPWSW
jgi:short-subunit dehydrogenase